MLLAVLIDGDGSRYVRHSCTPGRCPHVQLASLRSADVWVTPDGRLAPEKDPFVPPPDGMLITSYASPGRVYSGTAGALSLKWTVRGEETYEVGRGLHAVPGESWLAVNEGRTYRSVIEDGAETFCVSFGRRLAADVARCLEAPIDALLDDPRPEGAPAVNLLETVSRGRDRVLETLADLRHHMARPEALQELGMQSLQRLLESQARTLGEADVRRAARLEVYRRLLRARDYIEATLAEEGSLDLWAATADMSRFHFLRSFRDAFGQTPRQYLIARRLERARELLASTGATATSIALDLGFDSLSHFTNAYRKRFGHPPGRR